MKSNRIESIDILKGLVMVLMAIDHVRVYSGISAGSLEVGEFFTRWITHFCAPAFTFFAGTSILLMDKKINDKRKLSKQLFIKGVILIILELTLLHLFWTFNFNFTEYILAGVIWMLGACMIIMAAIIWLKPTVIGFLGVVIILVQQLFAKVPQYVPDSLYDPFLLFWRFIYPTGFENPQTDTVVVLYVIVPWIGVMACGYAFGMLFQMNSAQRKKICVSLGLSLTLLFLVIGSYHVFNVTDSNEPRSFVLELLRQQKYPASILFLMMTLGPLILLVPFVEKIKGRIINALKLIGKVPLFYYILHILLIHLSALAVHFITEGTFHNEWFDYAPFTFVPEASKWSLLTLYTVFTADVILLYAACKWYVQYKATHPQNKFIKYL